MRSRDLYFAFSKSICGGDGDKTKSEASFKQKDEENRHIGILNEIFEANFTEDVSVTRNLSVSYKVSQSMCVFRGGISRPP